MQIPEFAKEISLGQKAKPGRKKKTTKALVFQPDAPKLNQEAEDEDYYDLDAESLETNVPSISIVTELQAHIFDDENNIENDNLFNNYIYKDENESLHSRLMNDLRSADPDNDFNVQFKSFKIIRRLVYDDEE